jgi:arylsulfatase A-like enzyme
MKTLVVDVDSMRPDHVGAYGYAPKTTPRIDEFAADATVFERAYAANSPCMPARAGLLSGRYGVHNGVATHGSPGQTLTGTHRRHALSGKPCEWFALPELCFRRRVPTVAVSSFPRHPAPWFYRLWHESRQPPEPPGRGEYFQTPRGETVADLAIDALDCHADGDFLLYAQFWDPHTPYQRPESEVEQFADAPLPEHPTAAEIERHREWDTWRNARSEGIGGRVDLRSTLAAYDAETRYVDGQVGRLLDALRDRGVYGETLVVLIADHGEAFGEHGRYREHGDVHEPTQRIPLLAKPPGPTASSVRPRTDAVVTNVDLAPTVADYAGFDAPARW